MASAAGALSDVGAAGRAVSSGLTMASAALREMRRVEGGLSRLTQAGADEAGADEHRDHRRPAVFPDPPHAPVGGRFVVGHQQWGRRRVPRLLADGPVRQRPRLGAGRRRAAAGSGRPGPRARAAAPAARGGSGRSGSVAGRRLGRTGSGRVGSARGGSAGHLGRRLDRRHAPHRRRRRAIHLDGRDQAVGLIEKLPHLAQPEPAR